MTARSDEIAHLISLEIGKALVDARGETAHGRSSSSRGAFAWGELITTVVEVGVYSGLLVPLRNEPSVWVREVSS